MQFFCFMSPKCSIFLSHSIPLTHTHNHTHTHFHHRPFHSLFSHSHIHSSISHCIHLQVLQEETEWTVEYEDMMTYLCEGYAELVNAEC